MLGAAAAAFLSAATNLLLVQATPLDGKHTATTVVWGQTTFAPFVSTSLAPSLAPTAEPGATPFLRASGVVEASMTVLLTTFEDCIWLIPFVAQASSRRVALVHGLIFVITYVFLALLTCLLSLALQESLSTVLQDNDAVLEAIGAFLCWILAAVLFFRDWKKEMEYIQQNRRPTSIIIPIDELSVDIDCYNNGGGSQEEGSAFGSLGDRGNSGQDRSELYSKRQSTQRRPHRRMPSDLTMDDIIDRQGAKQCEQDDETNPLVREISERNDLQVMRSYAAQPLTIITLTVLGGVDEISYFPALIVGEVFTVPELCLGTLLASLVLLAGIECIIARLPQCLIVLEHLPVYAVVTLFAFVLTLHGVWVLASDTITDQIQEQWKNATETFALEQADNSDAPCCRR